ncbi:MAG: Fic family protein [Pyrinomonadaceae bacterium]
MSDYKIPDLPLDIDLESKAVLKKVAEARSALAELKGAATSIPNESVLINTLSLQEAKDSSAIENIITTHDELFQSDARANAFKSVASKEVYAYAAALRAGHDSVVDRGFLSSNQIVDIQAILEENSAGYRKLPGTALKNEQTGEVVYTPPQTNEEIVELMNNLEEFINDDDLSDLDPLVKMAIIHHQFESIHPFYDGNGRTGRIINILYLVRTGLLHIPILYLSRFINQNKADYYRLLQAVRTDNVWEDWVLFMLAGVEKTSRFTIEQIEGIKYLMQKHKHNLRRELPKIYSQDLLNNLFTHTYTKIDFVMTDLAVSRPTATRYLEELVSIGMLYKHKLGKDNYYINKDLFDLLAKNEVERV